MKNILKLFVLLIVTGLFASCEKKIAEVTVEGATPPVLTSSVSGTIPLSFASQSQQAVKLSWTNPEYRFSTGPNSQNVTYLLEIDTTGANFTNPSRKAISISSDLSLTLTQSELNDYLLNQLQLNTTMNHNVEMRVRSTIGTTALPLFSNVLKFVVRPYAIPPKVAPPASGKLYLVGNATPGGDATGWNNPVPTPSQEFKKVSETIYELTIPLNSAKSYLFLPVNGSWAAKYGFIGGNNSNNPDGDDFKPEGGDMLSPASSGNYKITVDFQRGKWTVTKM